ncbi:MAG: hypothetical protein HY615_01885 [Candidatus Rokubacteria bacterium]|nr:hypothetical protein [Candidatus Rokubacteria bacterium]
MAVCQQCGGTIEDASMGGVVWAWDAWHDGDRASVRVLCKTNHCLARGEGRGLPWMPLGQYLLFLTQNVGLRGGKLREARRRADLMASTG